MNTQTAFRSTHRAFKGALFLALASILSIYQADAAFITYTTNFDEFANGTLTSPFTAVDTSPGTSLIVVASGANKVLQQETQAADGRTYASIDGWSGAGSPTAGETFTLTATFNVQSFLAGGVSNVSVNALSDSGSTNLGYRLAYTVNAAAGNGTIALTALTGSSTGFTANAAVGSGITPAANMTLTLELIGTYTTASRIDFTGTLYDSNSIVRSTITGFDTSIGAGTWGENFGVRAASASGGWEISNVTSFSLVPEPSVTTLLLMGLLAITCSKRNRSARGHLC